MWSHEIAGAQFFAVHRDGAPSTAWSLETAVQGPGMVNDHISLKTLNGRVLAAVKTGKSGTAEPRIELLERSARGTWTTHPVATVAERNTRPIVVLDPATSSAYVFMTIGEGPTARGIAYKQASLDDLRFPAKSSTLIQGDGAINDATSTKQNATSQSGIAVLASSQTHYWWGRLGGSASLPPPQQPPPGPGITFRSASGAANPTATSLTLPRPSGVVAGDLLLASVVARGSPAFVAPPGWALVRQDAQGFVQRAASYVRVAGANEPAAYTWRWPGVQAAAGGISAYTGVDTDAPVDAHAGRASNGTASAAIVAPSVTTGAANERVVGVYAVARHAGIAPPAGTAERWERVSNAGRYHVTVASSDEPRASSGATGDRVAQASQAGWTVGQLISLRPAGASTTPPPSPPPGSGDKVIAAAGDIACDPASASYRGGAGTSSECHMRATSDLILDIAPDAVLTLGDNQYENGALEKFRASYHPTWGRVLGVTRPAVGNHEYQTRGAAGHFDYFGAAAGDRSKGYYSFNLGNWHLISLNSNCAEIGGCGRGSPQESWLRADLAAHPAACTLAYWHHPRFSSGSSHGNDPSTDGLWRALYDAGAEVILNGHDHDYERFAPQTPDGAADPARGIREFIVGTGGKSHHGFGTVRANSQVRNGSVFGVLELTLRASSYAWRFLPDTGGAAVDSGSTVCHTGATASRAARTGTSADADEPPAPAKGTSHLPQVPVPLPSGCVLPKPLGRVAPAASCN
jgi:hypothetical protein